MKESAIPDVVKGPTPSPASALQRKCKCGQHVSGEERPECKKQRLEKKVGVATSASVTPIAQQPFEKGQAPGYPAGSHFWKDFTQVPVHTKTSVEADALLRSGAIAKQILPGNDSESSAHPGSAVGVGLRREILRRSSVFLTPEYLVEQSVALEASISAEPKGAVGKITQRNLENELKGLGGNITWSKDGRIENVGFSSKLPGGKIVSRKITFMPPNKYLYITQLSPVQFERNSNSFKLSLQIRIELTLNRRPNSKGGQPVDGSPFVVAPAMPSLVPI